MWQLAQTIVLVDTVCKVAYSVVTYFIYLKFDEWQPRYNKIIA
jgi:hypothetical protein